MRIKLSLVCLVFLIPSIGLSQSITLSQVSGTFSDNGDFFTDILGRPKSFNNYCDLIDDQHYYSTKVVGNSVWTGQSLAKDGPIFSLMHVPTINTAIVQKIECGPDGFQKNFLADDYPVLSLKVRANSAASSAALLWSRDKVASIRGGFMPIGAQVGTPKFQPFRWNYNWFFLPGNPSLSESWFGKMTGISLAPTYPQNKGVISELDWVRLVNTNSSNSIRLNWSTNITNVVLPKVSIYLDDNNFGFDGSPIFEGESVNAFRDFPLGMLDPGTYYLYASLNSTINGQQVPQVNSNYIGPIVIDAKPQIKVIAPTRFSGVEYGRDERGDSWDFNSLGDLSNVPFGGNNPPQNFRYFHDYSVANGIFLAESDSNTPGNFGDVQMHPTLNAGKPIRTNLYRYFCVKMQMDAKNTPRDGNLKLLSDAGWYARVMYANSKVANTFGSTKGFQIVETSTSFPDIQNGFITYCLDLWDTDTHDTGARFQTVGLVDGLRFDPHEAFSPTKFAVDSMGLYSENYVDNSGKYLVKWDVTDRDSQNITIKVFLDDDNQGFNGTFLKLQDQNGSGLGQTQVDLSQFPDGKYFIYFEVIDGRNILKYYADEPIRKGGNPFSTLGKVAAAPCDKDGDRKSDFLMIRNFRGNAQWISQTQIGISKSSFWGYPASDLFLDSDIDGDLVSDQLVVRKSSQIQWWNLASSTGGGSSAYWGKYGDQPVLSDFDGDGKSDRTIFREEDGTWWTSLSNGGVEVKSWGLSGDIPVADDYDGDGRVDYGIWRPWSGYWAVTRSSTGFSTESTNVIWKQWGLFGDLVMPGDYTGDGRADLVVWRPSNGTWYVCSSGSSFDCGQGRGVQFGLPGDIPVKFDVDGDSVLDYVVFRPKNGIWYMKSSVTGAVTTKSFGSSVDYPLCSSPSAIKNFIR